MIALYIVRTSPFGRIIGITALEYDAVMVCIAHGWGYDPVPIDASAY